MMIVKVELVQVLRRLIREDSKNKKHKGPKLNQTSLSSSSSTSREGHRNLSIPACNINHSFRQQNK
jgi:hypothetical protein